jgi:hypothetical protein
MPFLLDILHEKRLALLDPASWEDKNDSYFLERYKKKKKLERVRAICFAYAEETYHHWKIYAGSTSGVCIIFNCHNLNEEVNHVKGFTGLKKVECKTISELKAKLPRLHVDDLPFLKRYAFLDESEYRIVYGDKDKEEKNKIKYLTITPDDIERIEINPWVNNLVFESIESIIRNIDGFENKEVKHSNVVENEEWKNMVDEIIATNRIKSGRIGL